MERRLSARQFDFDVYQPPAESAGPALAVRWVAREWVKSGQPIHYVSQRYASVRYIIEGRGLLRKGDEEWPLTAGAAVWGARGVPIVLESRPDEHLGCYVVLLMGGEVDRTLDQTFGSPVGARALARPELCEPILREIMREACAAGDHMAEDCLHLSRVLLNRMSIPAPPGVESNGSARETYRRCREHIERNFASIHGLSAVAETCGVTVPHLCRLFDQFGKASPHDYLTACRLQKAERLLLSSGASVQSVATSVGYGDWRLLCRNFKARYGDSPERYRKRLRASGSKDMRIRVRRTAHRGVKETARGARR
jgi:AraC-like DNA-binding protein